MTSAQIKRFLQSLNISDSDARSGVRIPQLRIIIADRNQGTLYHRDLIRFNFSDELIEIKQFNAKAANGVFNVLRGNGHYLNVIQNSTCKKQTKNYSYRNPEVGDKVYNVVNNRLVLLGTIQKLTDFKIELDTEVDNIEYSNLIYADAHQDIGLAEADPFNKNLYISYSPISNNVADVYMNFDGIIGFGTHTSATGLIGII